MKVLECCAVPDIQWKEIQKNPEMWARSAKIPELVAVIKKASAAYYNTETALLTDAAWDKLYDVLAERSPTNPLLTRVGSTSTGRKVRLPYYMPSLNKKKEAPSIMSWLAKYDGPYVLSDKLDGISLLINYLGNGNYNLYTRGNGSSGQDVTSVGQYLKIPAVSQKMAVRAEVIVPKSLFDNLAKQAGNTGSFNLRNMVSGLMNRSKGESPELKNAKVVAYEIVAPNLKPSDQFARLKSLGFVVAPHKVLDELDIDSLNNMLVGRVSKSIYDIDGIVVAQDKRNTRTTSGNPEYAFAFKNNLESEMKIVEVEKVIWQQSRHGYLKPVVIIKEYHNAI